MIHQDIINILKQGRTWTEVLIELEMLTEDVRKKSREEVGEAKGIEPGAEVPGELEAILNGGDYIIK